MRDRAARETRRHLPGPAGFGLPSGNRGCGNGGRRLKMTRPDKSAIIFKSFPLSLRQIQSFQFDLLACAKLYERVIQNYKFLSGRKTKNSRFKTG
jgi:hypothetical protein